MAGESVEIRIIAHDGTSQVFRAIQQNADRLGRDLTDAGRDGDKALDQIERGAKDADRAMDQASQSARSFGDRMEGAARGVDEFGEGLLVVGAGLTYAGNKAMEQERQIIALRAAYGDAADEMLRFAEELDAATIFDDEDIRAGERFFASLHNNYDVSIQEIQRLMQITADLASASGLSFEDASNRVTAAIRGEAEAAEWLGLTMNQQTIDREGLTLSMTNQEAAQFRLNALYQQAAVYEGTAAELAESSIGTYAELTDTVNDAAGALGDFIGPVGSIVSGVGMMTVGISGMVGGLGKLATVGRAAAGSMTALATATAPMIAALGAGAIIGGGIGGFMGEFVTSLRDGEGATKAFSDSTNLLAAALDELQDGDPVGFFRTLLFGIEEADTAMQAFNATASTLLDEAARQQVLGNTAAAEAIRQLVAETDNAIHASEDYLQSQQFLADAQLEANKRGISLASAQDILTNAYTQTDAEARVYTETINALAEAMLDPANNADEINAKLDDLKRQFDTGELTLDQYREGLVDLAREYGTLPGDIGDATNANADFTSSLADVASGADSAVAALGGLTQAVNDYSEAKAEHDKAEQEYLDANAQRDQERFDEERQRADERRREQEEEQNRRREYQQQEEEYEQASHEAMLSRWDEERAIREQRRAEEEEEDRARYQRAQELIAQSRALAGLDDPLSTINLTSLSTESSRFAEDIGIANAALENTFRIVVGNTNAMGQTAQATEDWIMDLVNVQGEWGKIDDLLSNGTITVAEYNGAIQAQTDILAANAVIQDEILGIQARQAPLIADLTEQQAEYLRGLGDMSSQQQLVALGWMDSATAAQAYEATTLAASAANGEFGASGRMMVEQMIQGAVAANPVLGEMLEQMGLISVGADGTITVHFGSVTDGVSEIERLTQSIDALIVTLGGIPPIDVDANTQSAIDQIAAVESAVGGLDGDSANVTVYGDGSPAQNAIGAASAALTGLDGNSATVYANAVDNASGVLGGVAGLINALDGAVATTYVQTVNLGTTGPSAFALGGTVWGDGPPAGRWGMVPQAANGRTVLVGEAGPELVSLPHGAQVTPHAASMSRLDAAPAEAPLTIHMPIYGNVYGIDELDEAIAYAVQSRRRGAGLAVTT